MIAERAMALRTADGETLEARIAEPPAIRGGVAVCHPHPLYGGDMDNPVVVRATEVCADLGLATLRFNFRGVGNSTGSHGNGVAERLDAEAAIDQLRGVVAPGAGVALVGYSFGALVSAHVAVLRPWLAGLCLVAPPLARAGAALPAELSTFPGAFHVAAGTRDEYCPVAELDALSGAFPGARVAIVEGANHFFFGKLFPLGQAIATWARAAFAP